MKVLLLGGTGAMGVYLAPILSRQGVMVYVTTRHYYANSDRIAYIVGNAMDVAFVENVCAEIRPDVIVDFMLYNTSEFRERKEKLLGLSGQYVFVSSYRVFADDKIITEKTPRLLDASNDLEYLNTDEYALCKARCENALREGVGHNWTIVRPSITFSRNRFQFGCLESNVVCFRSLQGLSVVMPDEMLRKKTTMSWAGDVALLISRLIGNDNALCDDFNVTASESHTWEEISMVYGDVIGLKCVSCSLDDYIRFNSRPQTLYDRMFDRKCDNSKVLAATGTRCEELSRPLDALRRELMVFKENPKYVGCDFKKNAYIDKLLNEKAHYSNWSDRFSYFRCSHSTFDLICRVCEKAKRMSLGLNH